MIVELIVEDQYGPEGPQVGAQGVVVETHKDSKGDKYFAVFFEDFVTRGVFYAFESMVKVIKK